MPPKERFILNGFLAVPYFSARRSVPITAVYIGSERDVPLTPSTSVAIPIDAGSLR